MAEEKRVYTDERRYAIITKESVKTMAESAGHAEISDMVAGILGEDASYRLREITQKSAQFMRHAKRRRMNIDDFNKACKHSDIQPVHGHRSDDAPPSFRTTKEGDIQFMDDPEVNLASEAFNEYMPKPLGDASIKAHWLSVEGVQKTASNPQGTQVNIKQEVSPTLQKYFEKITQAILSSDSEMMKTALVDLRSNSNISPLLPQFVSFASNAVKTVNYDLGQLMKGLCFIQSLVFNNFLFLETQPYLATLLQSVQYCLLEPVSYDTSQTGDQWSLRDYAARLLAHMVRIWSNGINHLERFTEKTLRDVLLDHSKQFCSHYGAVMGLLHLGTQSIERVLFPQLSTFWPHLTAGMIYKGPETMILQAEAYKVHGAIALCAEFVLRSKVQDFKERYFKKDTNSVESDDIKVENNTKLKQSSSGGFISMFDKSPSAFYNEISEYFGDSLTVKLPDIAELKCIVFKSNSKGANISLSDSETNKSGEQLLDELMEQIKQEEETSRKKKEREKYLKDKNERDQIEKIERRKQEQELRLADHRHQLLLRKQQQLAVESDDEIDVEGDNDRSDVSLNSEEDGGMESDLSVKSNIGAPGQGIKLTFTKRSKLPLGHAPQFEDSPLSDSFEMGEPVRNSKKRKYEVASPQEMASGFSFDDIADFDTPSFSQSAQFSGEGDQPVRSHHKKYF